MKRKFLIVLLSLVCALCLALGLTACNKGTTGGGSSGGTEQGDTEQGDTEQGGTEQGDDEQGDTEQGDTEQGDTEQGGTEQGDDEQGDTEQGDTEQGDTEQGGIEITVTLNYSLSSDGNSYTVSSIGSCTDTDIEIPSTYDGKPVTAIGNSAFYECTDIVAITIPESVITIGDGAFYGCSSLKSVTIPNSVTTIGASAFGDCSALITITIGEGVISIGGGAFSGCYKLLEIYNLSTLTITAGSSDNGGAAANAKNVYTSADAESKLSEESDFIFYNDNGKYYLIGYTGKDTDITLPDGVNGNSYEISNYAFYLNTKLTKVVISDGVTAIGYYAFSYCFSLVSVTIGSNVTSLGDEEYNGRIWSIDIFVRCYKLVEVYNLSSLDITAGSRYNGNVALYAKDVYTSTDSESKLIYKNDYIFYNDDGTYYLLGYKGTATDITLPKNINGNSYEIYDFAFYHCSNLISIIIPDSITSLSYGAFEYCTSLTNVTIPDSVTTIDSYAFYDCISLTNVTIGNNVTSIGDSAFYGCYSLANVIIPDSVTTISDRAFYGCYSLVSVTIGSGVTSIRGDEEEFFAFTCCYKLVEVYNLSSLDITAGSWGYGAVAYYAKNVYTATSGASNLIYKDDYIFYNDDGTYYLMGYTGTATAITLPDSINGNSYEIYDFAFYHCSNLISIIIPDSITSLSYGAFEYCTSLTNVTIPDSVTTIDSYAFCYCNSLTDVTIGSGVTSIEIGAFYDCTSLSNVYYGGTIDQWASILFGASLSDLPSESMTATTEKYLETANPLYYADNLYINGTLVTDFE